MEAAEDKQESVPTVVVSQAPTSPNSAQKRRRSASPSYAQSESKRAKVDLDSSVLSPVFENKESGKY